MSTIPSQPASVQSLATNVLQQFDTDHDGRLSVDEFSQFLNRLIDSLSGGETQAQNLMSSPSSLAQPQATQPLMAITTGQYRSSLEGFDFHKLDDPTHTTTKYEAARVFQNYAPTPSNLPQVVSALNAAGVSATQVGDDVIDFGGSVGQVDVIRGAGAGGLGWQWLPIS